MVALQGVVELIYLLDVEVELLEHVVELLGGDPALLLALVDQFLDNLFLVCQIHFPLFLSRRDGAQVLPELPLIHRRDLTAGFLILLLQDRLYIIIRFT